MQRLGWYLRKINVAKSGVFNTKDFTPMESVGLQNMWTVLNFISAEAAEAEFLYEE